MKNKTRELLMQYGRVLQQRLYPRLEEELGPLTEKHQQVVRVLGLARIAAAGGASRVGVGRPPRDRRAMARALVAKAVYNLATTRALPDFWQTDSRLRRICGWERQGEVPDESVFSRALAEFARTRLPQRVHEALIRKTQQERWIGHISRDATAIAARERPVRKTEKPPAAEGPQRRRPRGEPKPPEDMTRSERQKTMTLAEMLADLPTACAVGCQTNRHGRKETWRGYKLPRDVADGQIPIRGVLTSANLHDSQAAIPLATMTAARVTSLYDLMDSAYDCQRIEENSRSVGPVPILEKLQRGKGLVPRDPHQALRFDERTAVERVNARLKDEFGGRTVRVRGHRKVMAHLMFGVLALSVDRILRLCG